MSAVSSLCQEYRSVLDDEILLTFECVDAILARFRDFFMLYLEASLTDERNLAADADKVLETAEEEAKYESITMHSRNFYYDNIPLFFIERHVLSATITACW